MLTPNFYYCYTGILESVLTYCSICFFLCYVCLTQKYASPHLQNCSKIIGLPIQPVSQLTERAMARKAHAIANDPAHPLNTEFDLPSRRRYQYPKCRKKHFVPQAISHLNKHNNCCRGFHKEDNSWGDEGLTSQVHNLGLFAGSANHKALKHMEISD